MSFIAGFICGVLLALYWRFVPRPSLPPVEMEPVRYVRKGLAYYDPRLDGAIGGKAKGGACSDCYDTEVGRCWRCGCFDRRCDRPKEMPHHAE